MILFVCKTTTSRVKVAWLERTQDKAVSIFRQKIGRWLIFRIPKTTRKFTNKNLFDHKLQTIFSTKVVILETSEVYNCSIKFQIVLLGKILQTVLYRGKTWLKNTKDPSFALAGNQNTCINWNYRPTAYWYF